MNKETEITTTGIAELFGVNKNTFSASVDYIPDFPKPIRMETNRRIYNLTDVKQWSEEKNVVTIIRQASVTRQKEKYKAQKEKATAAKSSFTSINKMFFTGRLKKG